jgi:hypothetical protein
MYYSNGSLNWLLRNKRRGRGRGKNRTGPRFLIIRSRIFRLVWRRKRKLVPSEPVPHRDYQISGLSPIGL